MYDNSPEPPSFYPLNMHGFNNYSLWLLGILEDHTIISFKIFCI